MKRSVVLLIAGATLAACGSSEVAGADTTSIACTVGNFTVSPPTVTLHPADTLTVRANIIDCPGPQRTHAFRWRSGNLAIGIVDSVSGLITTRGLGTTTITATSMEDRTQSASVVLNVVP